MVCSLLTVNRSIEPTFKILLYHIDDIMIDKTLSIPFQDNSNISVTILAIYGIVTSYKQSNCNYSII